MTPDQVFSIANPAALLGWLVLIAGAITKRAFLYQTFARWAWPLALSAAYAALILFFFGTGEGNFNSLGGVQKLFSFPWLLVAGWIHYLAFDLFVGAWITAQVISRGLNRLALIVLLPLTFMFGLAGLLTFFLFNLAFAKRNIAA